MTFREWYKKEYEPVYEGHGMDDPEIAEMAWKAAHAEGYEDGFEAGYRSCLKIESEAE